MALGLFRSTNRTRPSIMLHFVAGGAKRNKADEFLHTRLIVIFPNLVALDWMLNANTAANLA